MSSGGSSKGLCPDWVFSSGSNVHVARDREWFVEYHSWKSTVAGRLGGMVDVIGIGVVEVPVKQSPNRSGPQAHGKLRLHNVLHAPNAMCNILGGLSTGDYAGATIAASKDGSEGKITDTSGRKIGYFISPEYTNLLILRLSGPPVGPVVGPSSFEKEVRYMIGVTWSDHEWQKWRTYQKDLSSRQPAGESQPTKQTTQSDSREVAGGASPRQGTATSTELYTAYEKEWLKKHWGSEFKFLQAYELSIYKGKDREEGRRIVRGILAQNRDDEDGKDGEESSGNEWNPEGHFADYHFSNNELDFIEGGWGDSANFMFSFGLKFYNDEDCREAKEIVRGLMDRDRHGANDDRETSSG
ncbi:hypothetical protein QBC43DRAFT_137198 [Cladorrhinum sp. PSN259]|nr:hypothetical protein QBC43DRAFT_137198 [Cladorrhinum sp. PSN259]